MSLPHLKEEKRRLASLHRLHLLDTPPEPAYDDLAQLAALMCETPIALITLLDENRQWFKARLGLSLQETPRSVAFCAHAIERNDGLFLVPDAHQDTRFQRNPLVTEDPHIRFYAGMPVAGPDGQPMGTICVLDREPRTLTAAQELALRVLGHEVEAQFKIRQQFLELQESHAKRLRVDLRLRENQRKLKAANARLRELIRTDALTGIQNRRAFDENLRQAWNLSARIGQPLSVLMIDIDHFKAINDEDGHDAGDEALKSIAHALQANVRATDLVFRYGGEEFAVLLPATQLDAALLVAEKLRRAVAERSHNGRAITVSIGLATDVAHTPGLTEARLVQVADAALYRAKNAGRNRVEHALQGKS